MTHSASSPRRRPEHALISVVLPVYNEAQVLPTLLASVTAALERTRAAYEILFVDDGSSDESPAILDRLAESTPQVRVIHLSRNFGHQPAVQAGLSFARGDAVVLMDSDMQDTPSAITAFVAKWREGYDVVYAIRSDRKEHAWKRFLFNAFHQFLARVASIPLPAEAGIFGLVDRRAAREILAMSERDRYFPGLRSWVGFRQTGLVIPRGARYDDHARVSLCGLFRLAKTAVFSFSTFPLLAFYAIGAAAGTVFVALAGFALFAKLFTDMAVPGWTSHILTGSFFGAMNALGICILGEYVIRIYDQVRARPLYLVDRVVNLRSTPSDSTPAAADQPEREILADLEQLRQMLPPADASPSPDADTVPMPLGQPSR
jgi:dolichol-phosphate mannosyltransferase